MTIKIYKSQIAGVDYPKAVEDYRQALLAHRFTGDAAPTAHSLIESAVVRVPCEGGPDDFIADFEVIDDTPPPPPPPSAEELRAALLSRMQVAESIAALSVMSQGKLRLLSLDARSASMKPIEDRTAHDVAALDAMKSFAEKRETIERHGAMLEITIEDLPADQIAGYEFTPFPS